MRLSSLLFASVLFAAPAVVLAQAGAVAPAVAASPAAIYAGKFEAQVKRKVDLDEADAKAYQGMLAQALQGRTDIAREQFFVLVDRNPKVQRLLVFLGTGTSAQLIGAASVATGSTGRFDHYITPLGVYEHTLLVDFRAQGTKNDNGIRGYGSKGMRIWDFGWFPATKGWKLKSAETGDIRLQMHATDPGVLEPKLGTPGSKGCVRIPESLNKFIDHYGILDGAYEQAIAAGQKTGWVLPKDREASTYSGRYLVVIDTAEEPVGI